MTEDKKRDIIIIMIVCLSLVGWSLVTHKYIDNNNYNDIAYRINKEGDDISE